jgi:microcystin-dependent protein
MALETGTYINSLVAANPAATDGLAQADDHLRLIKSTIKSTFANIDAAVTSNEDDLNILSGASAAGVTSTELQHLNGVTSALQTQLAALTSSVFLVPTGGIILWSGATSAIPTGYVICDGTNSTPDLRDRFVVGAGPTYAVDATGGAATVTLTEANLPAHTHVATSTVTDPGHAHQYTVSTGSGGIGESARDAEIDTNGLTESSTTSITVATSNATTGSGTAHENLPPYYALAYIMKTA